MYTRIKRWSTSILLVLLFTGNIGALSAQSGYGGIHGVVLSADDEPLAGANIVLPNIERGASTNQRGEFVISQLAAGTYTVVVKFIGYRPEIRTVKITAGKTSRMQFSLYRSFIESEPVVITGSPIAVDPLNSPQEISSISGREKIRLQAASLGKTIESIPGIYNISAGSVAGKPIIRGQTGERIRILSDGVAQEYQQYGERHAPNIDAFNAERLEIIKGAASLLYGSDALGGAINLIPYRFHIATGKKTEFNGAVTTAYHSNNNEYMAGAKFGVSRGKVGFKGALVRRRAGNFNTPAIDPFSQTGKKGDPKFSGEIDHTDFEQINGSLSAGVLTKAGLFSVHYDHYYNENNFLLPPGSPIGLRLENQILSAKANLPLGRFIFKPKLSYQRNHRQAAKPGESRQVLPDSANVDLVLDVYTGRFETEHTTLSGFSGTLGAEIRYYDHQNIGLVPLQPTGHFVNFALFAFEEWQAGNLALNFGARCDHRSQEFSESTTNPLLPGDDKRTFSSLSGAFGASYRLTKKLTAAANMGRGFRIPSFYNMYVYGYHGGVFAYQIGNPELDNETSFDMSASLRLRNERLSASVTGFQNRISNYIFLYNAPDHPLAPQGEGFVFAHDQADAVLTGLDLSIRYTLFDWLILGGDYSFIDSEFSGGPHKENELPLMPADRFCGEIKFILPDLSVIESPYLLFHIKQVEDKSAAGIYEPFGQFDDGIGPDIPFGVASTEAYTLLTVGVGFDLEIMARPLNFDLEITNLLDKYYRDFLDTYKGYASPPAEASISS